MTARRGTIRRGIARITNSATLGNDDVRQRSLRYAQRTRLADHEHAHGKPAFSAIIAYCLASGFASLTIGAAASLAVGSTSGKAVVWGAVTGLSSIAAGLSYDTRTLRGARLTIRRRLQALGYF